MVMKNGSVKMKDGKTMQMKDGDWMDMGGKNDENGKLCYNEGR